LPLGARFRHPLHLWRRHAARWWPERNTLEHQARRVVEQRLVDTVLRENLAALRAEAASAALPEDLDRLVRSILARQPDLSWDDAVAALVREEAA